MHYNSNHPDWIPILKFQSLEKSYAWGAWHMLKEFHHHFNKCFRLVTDDSEKNFEDCEIIDIINKPKKFKECLK